TIEVPSSRPPIVLWRTVGGCLLLQKLPIEGTEEMTMSKHGWPLGTSTHRVGTVHNAYAVGLVTLIGKRFKVNSEFKQFVGYDYGDVFVTARLSMQRFSDIKSFVAGYNAARSS